MFRPHLLEVDLQLLGDQHRNRRIGALAHLDIGHGQDDLPIGFDADEGVGRESIGRFRIVICEGQAQAQQQAAARGRAGLQEAAPGEGLRRGGSIGGGAGVIEDHVSLPAGPTARPA